MKIRIVKIGHPSLKEYLTIANKYLTRLRSFVEIENIYIKAHGGTEKSKKNLYSSLGLKGNQPFRNHRDYIIALDETGANWNSNQLANNIRKWTEDPGVKTLSFVIGGPYGLSKELKDSSNFIWSLSNAVLTSDMAWIIVWEQIYRSFSIIQGSSYHHGE